MFLGVPPSDIGQIGAGKHTATGRIDVAMIQSLVRSARVDDLVATYSHVIIDEATTSLLRPSSGSSGRSRHVSSSA